MPGKVSFTRRRFISASLQLAAGIVLASPLDGLASRLSQAEKIPFYHTHTRERFALDYSCEGCSEDTLVELNHFLRDFRTEEVHTIDPGLLDILHALRQETGCLGTVEVISGYRSPKTNRMLRARSSGVASRSLHMEGKALDFRLTGYNTRKLRDIAVSLKKGGVGYYAKSDFIHVDTGRVRTW